MNIMQTEVVEKKKRGRKPKTEKDNKLTTNRNDEENHHIMHLNISRNMCTTSNENNTSDLYESDFCKYNPELNIPYAYNEDQTFTSQPFEISSSSNIDKSANAIKTLFNHIDKKTMTDVACFWCCHKFDHQCIGMPIKYKNDTFEVQGCFCSFECMCAYNFYSGENSQQTWEIYNLINLMANILEYDKYIYPAPPRKCLKYFGGHMTISEFRKFKNSKKIINMNKAPLVVMVDQMEEINDYYHKQTDGYVCFDKERLEKIEKKINHENEENIRQNFKNTLDSSMNII